MNKEIDDIDDDSKALDHTQYVKNDACQSIMLEDGEESFADLSRINNVADPEDTYCKEDPIGYKPEPRRSFNVEVANSEKKNLSQEIETIKRAQILAEKENKRLLADIEEKNLIIKQFKDEQRRREEVIIHSEERKVEPVHEVPSSAFYDLVINFDSLKQLTHGWKIEYSEETEGEKKYLENKQRNCCVVAVLGNINKGKTFVLQQLSKYDLPNGYSVPTKGLSIKYPNNQGKAVTVLDCAGFEMPVKLVNNKIDGDNLVNNTKDEAIISETARDRAHTEEFVQSFILNQSNVQIVVVGILTFSDQKLINKLSNSSEEKSIFIVHNLSTYVTKSQVDSYIDETMVTTTKVKKNRYIIFDNNYKSSNEKTPKSEDYENNFYWQDVKYKNMVHLIMAKDVFSQALNRIESFLADKGSNLLLDVFEC